MDPTKPKNDKGIDGFCTFIEHATNRLSRKTDSEIDRDEIADRLEACAEVVRNGGFVEPATSKREINTEKRRRKGGKQGGLANRKKKKKATV